MSFSLRAMLLGGGAVLGMWDRPNHAAETTTTATPLAPPPPPGVLIKEDFTKCRFVRSHYETHDTKRMTFACSLGPPKDLQCVILHGPKNEQRAYVPISRGEGEFDILVQRIKKGSVSMWLHSLFVDETVAFKGPFPLLEWEEKKERKKNKKVFIADGVLGIAGVFPILEEGSQLLYSSPSVNDLALADDIMSKNKNIDAYFSIDTAKWGWQGGYGPLYRKQLLEGLLGRGEDASVTIFVSGADDFSTRVQATLKELGWAQENVKRVFGSW